jgi:hypothetical protein
MEEALIRPRLALLLEHFAELGDGRARWRVAYPLDEVLQLVTCATICSCDDFEDIVEWGEPDPAFLREFSEFHFGIPCARWLRDLLNRVDPGLFARCLEDWIASLWPGAADRSTAKRRAAPTTGARGAWRCTRCRPMPATPGLC